ncbi:heterodisulfide reductase-related iron-sulfur binding cluster [Calidifontibacillus erzurumensis]|uniref:4Fe-4S dicluster domain-containing protein n=1 Tax=Calidifontibacillus erzurumensis TaxID=2741433 RepID=A0A8J8K8I0_9BACI|nr:heterodisulfide reductase-related iron-sulfur binding cluster [Calidifontibacillus erzurumensis]NSL51906.1 4Fe-4S dicluster domain-containing protein [Calidifontibacillus erzurumensis]
MQEIFREYLPFLPGWTPYLMYTFFLVVVVFIGWAVSNKIKNYGINIKELWGELKTQYKNHGNEIFKRIIQNIIAQKKVRRDKYSAVMHLSIFYGMIFLFIGTFLVFLEQDILKHFGVESLIKGNFYLIYEFILELAGLLLVIGITMALYRRLVIKPKHLHSSHENFFLLLCLLYLGLSGFIIEGIRLTLQPVEWGVFSFIAYGISKVFISFQPSAETLGSIYVGLWWSHLFVAFAFIAVLPITVLKHVILIPLNQFLLPVDREKAKLTTPFNIMELEDQEDDEENELQIGIACAQDLNWKAKLNLAACVNCGRCESVCPAHASGRELNPRLFVQKLKNTFDKYTVNLEEQKVNFFESGLLTENEIWSCTNCGACMEECPAQIQHVDYILDLRRYLVAENKLDNQKTALFNNLDQNFNPLGLPSYKRNEWLVELGVPLLEENPTAEYLYWVGDLGSYDPRIQNVVKSFVEILKAAKVDFAIFTHEEKNDGEIPKRMGEEGRAQLIAMENVELLNSYEVKKIITHDPHAYNMLKHEYKDFGGNYEVYHHSVFLEQLIRENRVPLKTKTNERIVFHDSCNLSRWNNIFEEPRKVLQSVMDQPILEIKESKDKTSCCGAGGGNYWYKVPEQEKISNNRMKQLTVVEPETIALGCPFCLMMLEDSARTMEKDVRIKDLAEIVYENMAKEEKIEEAV